MSNELIKVGSYQQIFNDILGTEINNLDIYRSKGLPAHMLKRHHEKCLKYIDYIPDIIKNPDYIGVNPNESLQSIELIKQYKDNVLLGIKIDKNNEYLYVSTMHDITESKIQQRLFSGRLKHFSIDNNENE